MARVGLRRLGANSKTTEARALFVGTGALVLGFGIGFLAIRFQSVAISGRGSLGDVAALTAAGLAFIAFAIGYVMPAPTATRRIRPERTRLHFTIDILALSFIHGAITLLLVLVTAFTAQAAFVDATVYPLSAYALVGTASGLACYFSFLSGAGLTTSRLATVMALFLVLGVTSAMLTASDPHWWEQHLSALGGIHDLSGYTFDVSLIVGGIVLTSLAAYLTAELSAGSLTRSPDDTDDAPSRLRVRTLGGHFILLGVFLACVGLFGVDVAQLVHIAFASGLLVIFAILVLTIHRLVPGIGRTFLLMGYAFLAIVATAVIFFFIGYYTLTAVEIIAFSLIFAWLIVFIRQITAATQDAAEGAVDPESIPVAPTTPRA
jgi:hypothetical membrane protein